MKLPSLNGLLQFEVIFYEKRSVVLFPWNSPLSNPLVALVSLAAVFWRDTMVAQALQQKVNINHWNDFSESFG